MVRGASEIALPDFDVGQLSQAISMLCAVTEFLGEVECAATGFFRPFEVAPPVRKPANAEEGLHHESMPVERPGYLDQALVPLLSRVEVVQTLVDTPQLEMGIA